MAPTALWLVLCVLPGTLSYIPVIGIAAEPTAGNDKPALKKLGTSLLAASYGPCNHTVPAATTPHCTRLHTPKRLFLDWLVTNSSAAVTPSFVTLHVPFCQAIGEPYLAADIPLH